MQFERPKAPIGPWPEANQEHSPPARPCTGGSRFQCLLGDPLHGLILGNPGKYCCCLAIDARSGKSLENFHRVLLVDVRVFRLFYPRNRIQRKTEAIGESPGIRYIRSGRKVHAHSPFAGPICKVFALERQCVSDDLLQALFQNSRQACPVFLIVQFRSSGSTLIRKAPFFHR